MTTIELRNNLNRLMEEYPNTTNDEIFYYNNNLEIEIINNIDIKYDLEDIGRYIVIE